MSDLLSLIATGESQSLDIKAAFDKATIESMVAFAHARGGKVRVGVSNADKIIGTSVGKHTLNEWLGKIKSATSAGEIVDLYMQSLQPSWGAYEAMGYTVNKLSTAKIERFIRLVNQHGRFTLQEGDTIGALPKLNGIKNGRFKTPSTIIDDRQFSDTLFEVFEQSMKFIVSHIAVAFEFDGSVQRKVRLP